MQLETTVNASDVDENCFKSPKKIAEAIFIIKVILNCVGILASILVVFLILISKYYKRFVYRLVMYLMIVNSLQALCQILELTPVQVSMNEQVSVRNGTGWSQMCAALGFFDMVTSWMGNFVIVWIMFYMLVLSWRLHRLALRGSNDTRHSSTTFRQNPSGKCMEAIGVLLLLFSPFLFSWIPFTMDMYGLSGLWCWIKTAEKSNGCSDTKFAHKSLALIISMFYGPLVVIITFGFVCMVTIILLLCRSAKSLHGGNRDRYNEGIKSMGIVLVYPIIYCLFCVFLLINRFYSSIRSEGHHPNYALWIVHALADPSLNLIPALAFLLHPYVWKRLQHEQQPQEFTRFSIPPEDVDIDEGIEIQAADKYGSINSNSSCILAPK